MEFKARCPDAGRPAVLRFVALILALQRDRLTGLTETPDAAQEVHAHQRC